MGSKLKKFRKARGLTQEELAKRSGVSRETISALENGVSRNTSSKTLLCLAKALEASVEQIFFADTV